MWEQLALTLALTLGDDAAAGGNVPGDALLLESGVNNALLLEDGVSFLLLET